MNHAPDWWAFTLLALAAFRVTRLVGWDDLTIPLRRWVTGMSDAQHHETAEWVEKLQQQGTDPWEQPKHAGGPPPVGRSRFYASKLIHCPWCAGFWVAIGAYAAWLAWPEATLAASTPLALSSIVGVVARNLDP